MSRLVIGYVDGVTMVSFKDQRIHDDETVRIIGEQLFELVEDRGHTKIVLDFRNVEYLSSAIFGKLITLYKKVVGKAGKLVFCNINSRDYEAFEITRLHKLFNIQKDQAAALAQFAQPT